MKYCKSSERNNDCSFSLLTGIMRYSVFIDDARKTFSDEIACDKRRLRFASLWTLSSMANCSK